MKMPKELLGSESTEDVHLAVINVMIEAGIRDQIIYAYEKTGLLFKEEGWKKATRKDRRAWDKALDDFDSMTENERAAWRAGVIARVRA